MRKVNEQNDCGQRIKFRFYQLSGMKLPFTIEEFLVVFKEYNHSIWPVQVGLYCVAVFSVIAIIKNWQSGNRIVFSILAFLWFWTGLVYHILYFSTINPAANGFGGAFIVQGIIFFYFGAFKQTIKLKGELNSSGVIGMILIAYSLVLYPIIGNRFGHVFPSAPTFGTPCPTTIFTFGVLLFSVRRVAWYILIIPFLWSLIGFSAATTLQILEDYGLVVAGVVASGILTFIKPK